MIECLRPRFRQGAIVALWSLALLVLVGCQTRPPSSDESLINVAAQRDLAAQSTEAFGAAALPRVQWSGDALASTPALPMESARSGAPVAAPLGVAPVPGHDPKLTLAVSNAPLNDVLQAIAQVAGKNVVLADSVKGNVSVQLEGVPWRSALEVLLSANDLSVSDDTDQVMWIAPRAQVLAQRQQRMQAELADMALTPLQTKAYQMNYAKAVDVAAYLTGSKTRASVNKLKTQQGDDGLINRPSTQGLGLTGVLSSRGSVMPEPRTNQLFVSDVPTSLAKVAELIKHIDVPVRQVLIEARIVEADDSFSQELGVRLGGGVVPGVGVASAGGRRVLGVIGPSFDAVSGQLGGGTQAFVSLPSAGVGGYPPANFAVSLFTPDATRFINLELSALEADGRGVIVSRPSIVTADQVKALIEQGTEYPYQSTTSNGGTSVAFRRATLRLAVVPHITPHGQVMLQVDINKDSRGETTAQGVAINTKHVQTQVLVDNAGTAVIGGIFERYDRNVDTKVPLLGDIPGLGLLFRNRSSRSDKSEMLVFLTPHILQLPKGSVDGVTSPATDRRGGSVN